MSKTKDIRIIVAHDLNNGIGKDNKLPWGKLQVDMEWFKKITNHSKCLMGKNTYESIYNYRQDKVLAGEPLLPTRESYVLSSTMSSVPLGCSGGFSAFDDFMKSKLIGPIYIIGGSLLYQTAMAYANKLHITTIHNAYDCDAFFTYPIGVLDKFFISHRYPTKDAQTGIQLTFLSYNKYNKEV